MRSESKLNLFADALSGSCDWLFDAHVTHSGAHAPELITNDGSNSELTENIYIKLCEPGEPVACTVMVAEQIQSYMIIFELTKPNHSITALLVP